MAKKKIVIKEFPKEVLDITIQGNSDVILNKMTDEAIEEIKDRCVIADTVVLKQCIV